MYGEAFVLGCGSFAYLTPVRQWSTSVTVVVTSNECETSQTQDSATTAVARHWPLCLTPEGDSGALVVAQLRAL